MPNRSNSPLSSLIFASRWLQMPLYLGLIIAQAVTGECAVSQVKTGSVSLDQDAYADLRETVFLFQSQENYMGQKHKNVLCLKRSEILDFMNGSYAWLPLWLQQKMNICRTLSGA